MKRCSLCGASSTGAYCYAHSWAAGGKIRIDPNVPRRSYVDGWNAHRAHVEASSVPSRPAGHLELVSKPLIKPRRPSSPEGTIAARLRDRESREMTT